MPSPGRRRGLGRRSLSSGAGSTGAAGTRSWSTARRSLIPPRSDEAFPPGPVGIRWLVSALVSGGRDGGDAEGADGTTGPRRSPFGLHAAAVVVLIVGVTIAGVLALAAWTVHRNNESRLL